MGSILMVLLLSVFSQLRYARTADDKDSSLKIYSPPPSPPKLQAPSERCCRESCAPPLSCGKFPCVSSPPPSTCGSSCAPPPSETPSGSGGSPCQNGNHHTPPPPPSRVCYKKIHCDPRSLPVKDTERLNSLLLAHYVLSEAYTRAAFTRLEEHKDDETFRLLSSFCMESIQHTSALLELLKERASSRPAKLDVTSGMYARAMNTAFQGTALEPPFEAYESSTNALLALYAVGPSVVSTLSASILPVLHCGKTQTVVARSLVSAAGQDAAIKQLLKLRRDALVKPYEHTVSEFTDRIHHMHKNMSWTGTDGRVSEGVNLSMTMFNAFGVFPNN